MPENSNERIYSRGGYDSNGYDRSSSNHTSTRTTDDVFMGMPPYDETAEMAVLGGMLMSNDVIAEVSEILDAHEFYVPKHQTIYSAIVERFAGGEQVDPVLVADTLRVKTSSKSWWRRPSR